MHCTFLTVGSVLLLLDCYPITSFASHLQSRNLNESQSTISQSIYPGLGSHPSTPSSTSGKGYNSEHDPNMQSYGNPPSGGGGGLPGPGMDSGGPSGSGGFGLEEDLSPPSTAKPASGNSNGNASGAKSGLSIETASANHNCQKSKIHMDSGGSGPVIINGSNVQVGRRKDGNECRKIACKLMTGMQATSIFVSAMSITAIARDRYHVIVNPTQNSSKISNTLIRTIFIWAFALLLASPLFFYKRICQVTVPDAIADRIDTPLYYCFEDWPSTDSRNNYSLFTCIFQYLLPTIIVVISYTHIYQKLKGRMSQKRSVIKLDERIKAEEKRTRRTNTLLISISLIFCISWMPLYILNLASDFKLLKLDDKDYRIVFAVCHIIGMSSACINPLLYGWLNDNFQKEFKEIFSVQL